MRPYWFLWENIFKKFLLYWAFIAAQDFSIYSKQGLLCNCSGLFFNPVLLLSRSQALGHSGSVAVVRQLSCPGAFAVFQNQVSNAYFKHWIKRENTVEGIWNTSLLHETWYHGLLMRRLIEDCPLLQATSWDQDWFRFPSQVFLQHLDCPAMWLCSCLSFWNTLDPQLPEGKAVTWLICKYT